MRPVRAVLLALAGALVLPAHAQDDAPAASLGSGLTLTGAPTQRELQAQQRACESRKPPRKAAGTIAESTYRRLERIIDQISKGQSAEAETKLIELAQGDRDGYEKALILQTLGFVYATTKREAQAIKTFEQALATNALPQQVHEGMLFNVAQLYIADARYDQGMKALDTYLQETCNPRPEAHVLLASVHAEKKQWRESLKQIDLALVKAGTPKEQWLQLKLALHYELKEFPRCAEVLVHLVGLSPMKQDYWKQLSGMLLEIRKDPEALATLSLADRRGFIDEEHEFRNLANLYMYLQIPLKAAQVLERGFAAKKVEGTERNFETLANAWLVAREWEKAEVAMAQAAQASDKGELFKRLAQIQMESENWKGALESLKKARQKGGLKDPGEAAFLLGVVAVQLKQWDVAEQALRAAMQSDKMAKMAAEWLNHLQEEVAYTSANEAADKPTN